MIKIFTRVGIGVTTHSALQKVSTFKELVAVTQKYAKRVQLEQNNKDKKLFVDAVTNTQTDSLLIQAIEKQNESINAIATSLKFGNKPAENKTYQNPSTNTDFHQQMDRLTESMLSLSGLLLSNIQNNIIRNQQRNIQANSRNQPRQTNFPYPAQESNNFKSRPGNEFQQPATQAVQQPPTVSAGQGGQHFQNQNPNFTPTCSAYTIPTPTFSANSTKPSGNSTPTSTHSANFPAVSATRSNLSPLATDWYEMYKLRPYKSQH